MKVKQFIGPFSGAPLDLTEIDSTKIVQIGIEFPRVSPFLDYQWAVLSIDDIEYSVGETDILEFGDLDLSVSEISVLDLSNPYLIIDIAYE